MVKLVYILRRRSELSFAQFSERWRHEHAALVREVAPDIGLVRYVQSHTLETKLNAQLAESRAMGEPFDGVTEVWWESMAALQAAVASEAGQAAMQRLVADEAEFIDLGRSAIFLTEEYEVIGA